MRPLPEIRYLCSDCRIFLCHPAIGFHAVNEVGRKFCDRCGGNRDNLNVVGQEEYERLLSEAREKA